MIGEPFHTHPEDNAREGGLPIVIGADIELGNFILGVERPGGTGREAAHLLLQEIDGVMGRPRACGYGAAHRESSGAWSGSDGSCAPSGGWSHARDREDGWSRGAPSRGGSSGHDREDDWGRRFLPSNGGCAYIDQGHLELAAPEVVSAFDHVASWHAMLRIARRALGAANRRLPPGWRLQVLVNNSDGRGNSYGSHLSFRVTRRTWENLFERRLHYLLWLAGFQVSSVVWSGQGKVGSENGSPPVDFQLAQRADFFEQLVGPQTTYARPLVNSRDEAHCGRSRESGARLHVIFFDNALAPVACLLRAGTMQIMLALIEADRVDLGILLEDPLEAVRAFSRDPTLRARARTCDGRRLTAVELQRLYLERARRFAERGGFDGMVPRAPEILSLWDETLGLLERHDEGALARRVDWALKLAVLERARRARPGLSSGDPTLRHLDQLYGSLDAAEGLYWGFERSGLVERVVDEEAIRRFVNDPPDDTRAWTRAMLLRRVGAERIEEVDWDVIRLRTGHAFGVTPRRLDLADPLGHGRTEAAAAFERPADLEELLDALDRASAAAGAERRQDDEHA